MARTRKGSAPAADTARGAEAANAGGGLQAQYSAIPAELRTRPQWVCSNADKLPLSPRTGQIASVTDPGTWGSFEEACARGAQYVGFVLTASDPYCIIDLDNKPDRVFTEEDRRVHDAILHHFDSYTERSASGHGYHVVTRGTLPKGYRRGNVEVYSDQRYMIFTGNVTNERPIVDRQELLDQLVATMHPVGSAVDLMQVDSEVSDAEVCDMASNAGGDVTDFAGNRMSSGEKYDRLCRGEWAAMGYPSQSEADYALLAMLCYYTRDNEQVRRLFRYTALGKRDKAIRNDKYLDRALQSLRAKEPPLVQLDAARQNAERLRDGDATVATSAGCFRVVDLHDPTPPAPQVFVLNPILPAGVLTLLASHGGIGKTNLALVISAHIAADRPFGPYAAAGGPVLFVSLEDEGDKVRGELDAIIDAYNLSADTVKARLTVCDGTIGDAALMTEERGGHGHGTRFTPAMGELDRLAVGRQLIVIDNASDAFDANENERRAVRKFVSKLASIARREGASVLLLAHIDKAAARFGSKGNSYSGSTAWHNSARSRLALTATEEGSGFVELVHEKANRSKRAGKLRLLWRSHGNFAVLEPECQDRAAMRELQQAIQRDEDDKAVLQAIQTAVNCGHVVPTAEQGQRTAVKVLKLHGALPEQYMDADERVKAAVRRLAAKGSIVATEYKTKQRKESTKWLPTS